MDEIIKVFGINWGLLIIQMVNFALLLVVLRHFLYKPVTKLLQKRVEKIEKGMKDADNAREELEKANEEKGRILSEASKESDNMVELSRQKAAEVKSEILKEAEDKSRKMLAESRERAEEEKQKIIAKSKEEVAKLAVLSAEKILREKA